MDKVKITYKKSYFLLLALVLSMTSLVIAIPQYNKLNQESSTTTINNYIFNGTNISGGGNASWNESYANTLYYPISSNPESYLIYTDTISQSESAWQLNDGFITFGNDGNDNWQIDVGGINIPSYLQVSSPAQGGLGYNYSSNTPLFYNGTKWLNFNTSNGGSDNSSWNQSYANTLYSAIQWGYNMTTPFTNWLSTFAYNYNQTTPAVTLLNTTYGYTWKNWTGEANATLYNQYGKWWYNMSTGGSSTPNDGITIKYQNITNIPSCSSGQFLTNSTGSLTCATPSGSSSARDIKYTVNNSINATGLTFVDLFSHTLTANTNYTYDCVIVRSSNATTSGIRYNITMSGVPTYITFSQDAYTSATAKQNSVCIGSVRSCMPTAVTASLAYPTALKDTLNAYIEVGASAGGQMNLSFSGELAGLRATVRRGSYCELKAI